MWKEPWELYFIPPIINAPPGENDMGGGSCHWNKRTSSSSDRKRHEVLYSCISMPPEQQTVMMCRRWNKKVPTLHDVTDSEPVWIFCSGHRTSICCCMNQKLFKKKKRLSAISLTMTVHSYNFYLLIAFVINIVLLDSALCRPAEEEM